MSAHAPKPTDATGIIEEHIDHMPAEYRRHYWLIMNYACDKCDHRMKFFLEDGCEGPREREAPAPGEMLVRYRERMGGFGKMPRTIPHTKSGRVVLPVPFVAAACPKCASGSLTHVDWQSDKRHDTTWVPASAGRFHYPADWTAYNACGEPILPETTDAE